MMPSQEIANGLRAVRSAGCTLLLVNTILLTSKSLFTIFSRHVQELADPRDRQLPRHEKCLRRPLNDRALVAMKNGLHFIDRLFTGLETELPSSGSTATFRNVF
jgi:hypothetical protein